VAKAHPIVGHGRTHDAGVAFEISAIVGSDLEIDAANIVVIVGEIIDGGMRSLARFRDLRGDRQRRQRENENEAGKQPGSPHH
jgi:hypothetical protein